MNWQASKDNYEMNNSIIEIVDYGKERKERRKNLLTNNITLIINTNSFDRYLM